MGNINLIIERIKANSGEAVYWNNRIISYKEFYSLIAEWLEIFVLKEIRPGDICAYYGDYSPKSCALAFALILNKNILVPYTAVVDKEIDEYNKIATIDWFIKFDSDDSFYINRVIDFPLKNQLIRDFYSRNTAGLIVFTSGSTGKPKGILQDCNNVLKKFIDSKKSLRTVLFLMMDHFGGFNTMLSVFTSGGLAICLSDRKPETVCETIEKSEAELLPATPTFLNMLINSGAYNNCNLSSLKLITYGTEMMAPSTLARLNQIFQNSQIKQTYGLSELGVLHSKSREGGSVWVRIGGKGFETKVIDGVLWIRSEANMVGYLNAPNPIDNEGWMCTGDLVEVEGEYVRFLGRKSDIINVGGQKVFPAEVEAILMEDENVADAIVAAQPNQIMGNIVVAYLILKSDEDKNILTARLRIHCLSKLAKYKVPVKFSILSELQHSARFKKIRKDN